MFPTTFRTVVPPETNSCLFVAGYVIFPKNTCKMFDHTRVKFYRNRLKVVGNIENYINITHCENYRKWLI